MRYCIFVWCKRLGLFVAMVSALVYHENDETLPRKSRMNSDDSTSVSDSRVFFCWTGVNSGSSLDSQ